MKYKCDYCNITFKNNKNARRKHLAGLSHQKAKKEYELFYGRNAKTILIEESAKLPCLKLRNGYCMFGALCKYSHYSEDDLNQCREIVKSEEHRKCLAEYESTKMNMLSDWLQKVYYTGKLLDPVVESWIIPKFIEDNSFNMPPSLRKFNTNDFKSKQFESWG